MRCERAQEWMVEALYHELDDERAVEFNDHLHGCRACTALFEEIRATAALMNQHQRPDPGQAFWSSYYERLHARMNEEPVVLDSARATARRWSYVSWGYRVAAVVAVLAVGMWLGRSTITRDGARDATRVATPAGNDSTTDGFAHKDSTPRDEIAASTTPGGESRTRGNTPATQRNGPAVLASADERARSYIERSQILLLALVNANPDSAGAGTAGFGSERARAGVLVSEGAALQDDLSGGADRRLRELVAELEMVMREIANLEADNDLDAVQIIRNRVDREGVLLQINVEQMRNTHSKQTSPHRNGAID